MRQAEFMMASLKRLAILGLTAFVLVQPVGTHADEDDDGDHDRARDLYEQGEIKGLADILDIVRTQAPGDVVAVKLVRRANKWVYRFQVVGADGRRTIVDVDAGAGVILRDGEGDR